MTEDRQPPNGDHSGRWDAKTIAAIISAVVSVGSCVAAWTSYQLALTTLESNERVVRVNAYMNMRKDFREIRRHIPDKYLAEDLPPPPETEPARKSITNYWQLAFDEWYLTTQLGDPGLKPLWEERYKHLIAPQMHRKAFREVLCYLIKEKFVQNPMQRKFGDELKTLYKDKNNKELCSTD